MSLKVCGLDYREQNSMFDLLLLTYNIVCTYNTYICAHVKQMDVHVCVISGYVNICIKTV